MRKTSNSEDTGCVDSQFDHQRIQHTKPLSSYLTRSYETAWRRKQKTNDAAEAKTLTDMVQEVLKK